MSLPEELDNDIEAQLSIPQRPPSIFEVRALLCLSICAAAARRVQCSCKCRLQRESEQAFCSRRRQGACIFERCPGLPA